MPLLKWLEINMLSKLLVKIRSFFSSGPFGPRPGSPDEFRQSVGDTLLFDFDSDALNNESIETLTRQLEWFKKYPKFDILVEGHCDDRGTREYNLALGQRRALKVRQYLIDHGFKAEIEYVSYGKERPCMVGENEAAWRINRRVVIILR